MRKAGYKKAAALFLVTSLAASTVLAGCGKKKVDYNMGDGDDSSGGGGKLAGKLDVPESYTGKLEGIDSETGLSEVSVNASTIEVPDTDKMSVVYYTLNTTDNEYKKRVCENFFDVNAGIYVYSWEKPYKGDLEKEIERMQKYADQSTSDDDKSYFDDYISSLKEQLKTATDEREGAGDYSGDSFIGSRGENSFMITFNSADSGMGGGFSIDYYPSDGLINYKPKDGATNVYCYSAEYYDGTDLTNTATMSEDDAVQKGLEFLAGCGISDVIKTNSTDLLWDYSDASYNSVGAEMDGYEVVYNRSVEGTAPYTPNVYNVDILNSSDTWYDTMDETFDLCMDDNGIVTAYCNDFYKATGDKDDNVKLLSWDDVLKALPKAVNTLYTEHKTQYSTIEFNDVRLTYYKLKDGDSYKYTPVWVFAQCDTKADSEGTTDETKKNELDKDNPLQIVMMDAQTGDLIDLTKVLDSESYAADGSIIGGDDTYSEDEDGEGEMIISSEEEGEIVPKSDVTDDSADMTIDDVSDADSSDLEDAAE